ncbi:DUF6343 family protein [Streptomyces sp. XM4011]|uniref:DUF6343 family protein n=1 Tax=Streptomyces sp. XM4011 TaxID=2929780 RepID=UPI001FF844FD|nr:DUF6343 family protein [Streptomyces sp. XM4011]MCK1815709.1 DUF6343 family protein [Streptomyces sp. XM4011]
MDNRRHRRTGTEPITAKSDLPLRRLLSLIFLPLFAAGTVLLAIWAANSDSGSSPGRAPLLTLAIVCGVLTVVAFLDLLVIRRRRREGRASRR